MEFPRVDVNTARQGVETPTTRGDFVISDWLGRMEPTRGESCPTGQHRDPAAPGDHNFPFLIINPSIQLQLQLLGDENGHPPG